MSENLDLVRSICAALKRRDLNPAEWAHPDIEFVLADGPAPGAWRGLATLDSGARVAEAGRYVSGRLTVLTTAR